ncbi:hypothetical protein [Streptomyces hokutonensis]|uniref:hypothetical protein n=1 Tax=Streptomyces hokutonensis TaxID=1306990 RepID=UPI003807B36C
MDRMNDTAARRIEIRAQGGRADIEIDGTSIAPSAVKAYSVSHFAGERTAVLLHVADRGDTRWAGLARVTVATCLTPVRRLPSSSKAIAPEVLERAALARPDLGTEPFSLMKAMLTQLGEWVRGGTARVVRTTRHDRPDAHLKNRRPLSAQLAEARHHATYAVHQEVLPAVSPRRAHRAVMSRGETIAVEGN